MIWKNVKLCKCTRFSDCPLSSLEQFLALQNSADNGFKLLLVRVNFLTVLHHSLYVYLILVALMNDTVSIIHWTYFRVVDSQALLTSVR